MSYLESPKGPCWQEVETSWVLGWRRSFIENISFEGDTTVQEEGEVCPKIFWSFYDSRMHWHCHLLPWFARSSGQFSWYIPYLYAEKACEGEDKASIVDILGMDIKPNVCVLVDPVWIVNSKKTYKKQGHQNSKSLVEREWAQSHLGVKGWDAPWLPTFVCALAWITRM